MSIFPNFETNKISFLTPNFSHNNSFIVNFLIVNHNMVFLHASKNRRTTTLNWRLTSNLTEGMHFLLETNELELNVGQ